MLVPCCPRGSRQHCEGKILFNVVLILLGQYWSGKNLVQMLSKRLQTTLHMKKILFNNVVILLGQHCTDKNPVQCCPRDSRQNCTGKNLVQCRLNNGNFYFEPVNFLIITGCCKCRNNIAQIFPTLHKKNPGPTLNKKTRLYGTPPKNSY